MKIIILGAGQVGVALAKYLTLKNNDIVLVDKDQQLLNQIKERIDIGTVCGHASYPDILAAAGGEEANILLALTDNDETNLIACQVAHELFTVPLKCARLKSEFIGNQPKIFYNQAFAIDVIITPEKLVSNHLTKLTTYPGSIFVTDFAENNLNFVTLKINRNNKFINKSIIQVMQYFSENQVRFIAILRNNKCIIINKNTVIKAFDEVSFFARKIETNHIIRTILTSAPIYQNIMIAGGGNIGFDLAKTLEYDYKVKIIEHSPSRVHFLAENLRKTIVLNGEASDNDLLVDEDIDETDIFCAVTNSDSTNIMSSLVAKKLGAKKTFTLIAHENYYNLMAHSKLDLIISPQDITVNSILKYLHSNIFKNLHFIPTLKAYIAEIIIEDKHDNIINNTITHLKLPKDIIAISLFKENKIFMNINNIILNSKDCLIFFCTKDKSLDQLEQIFTPTPTT